MASVITTGRNRAAGIIFIIAFLCAAAAFFSIHAGTIDFSEAAIALIALGLAVIFI